MKSEENTGFACLGLFVGAVVTMVGAAIIDGFVVAKLWEWFLVPNGVFSLSIPNAIGISLIFGLFQTTSAKEKSKDFASTFVLAFGGPLLFLLMGWIVQSFM